MDVNSIPQDRAPAPLRLRNIALLLVGGLIGGSGIGYIASVAARVFSHSRFVTVIVIGSCIYGTWILGYHWGANEQWWIGLRARFAPVGRWPLLLGSLTGVALIAAASIALTVLKFAGINLVHPPEPPILPHAWQQLPFALILVSIVGPLCEELLFRGLLLDWLKQKTNVWAAAIVLSIIFSLIHGNPFWLGAIGWFAFFNRFFLGIATSGLRIRYGSLLPSFAAHATLNGFVCIAAMTEQGA